MGMIKIEGMEFYAFHGYYETERKSGHKFTVDLELKTNLQKAAENDQLSDTINYQEVYNTVAGEMKIKSYLLENVAHRILNKLYERFITIEKATVKISKQNPPMGGQIEKVSIILTK